MYHARLHNFQHFGTILIVSHSGTREERYTDIEEIFRLRIDEASLVETHIYKLAHLRVKTTYIWENIFNCPIYQLLVHMV